MHKGWYFKPDFIIRQRVVIYCHRLKIRKIICDIVRDIVLAASIA